SKMQIDMVALNRDAHIAQLPIMCRALRLAAQLIPMCQYPTYKASTFLKSAKGKTRSASNSLIEQQRTTATHLAHQPRPTMIRSHQSGLGRRQRDSIIALSEFSIPP